MSNIKLLKNENGYVNFPTREDIKDLKRVSASDYALANNCDNMSKVEAYDGKLGACAWLSEHAEGNEKLKGVLVNHVMGNYTNSYEDQTGYGNLPTAKFDVKSVLSNGYEIYEVKVASGNTVRMIEMAQLQYPQTRVDAKLSATLETMLKQNKLAKTGKTYGLNKDAEFELNGKFYVRTVAKNDKYVVSYNDGKEFKNNEEIWVAVEPIKWVILSQNGSELNLMSAKILTAGTYNELNKYNNTEFLKEIDRNNVLKLVEQKEDSLEAERKNAVKEQIVLEQEDNELEKALKPKAKLDRLAKEFDIDNAKEKVIANEDAALEKALKPKAKEDSLAKEFDCAVRKEREDGFEL